MPHIEPFLEDILPKKEPLRVAKWYSDVMLLLVVVSTAILILYS